MEVKLPNLLGNYARPTNRWTLTSNEWNISSNKVFFLDILARPLAGNELARAAGVLHQKKTVEGEVEVDKKKKFKLTLQHQFS